MISLIFIVIIGLNFKYQFSISLTIIRKQSTKPSQPPSLQLLIIKIDSIQILIHCSLILHKNTIGIVILRMALIVGNLNFGDIVLDLQDILKVSWDTLGGFLVFFVWVLLLYGFLEWVFLCMPASSFDIIIATSTTLHVRLMTFPYFLLFRPLDMSS